MIVNFSAGDFLTVIGISVTVSLSFFKWLQNKMSFLYRRIDQVDQKIEMVKRENSDEMKELSKAFQDFRVEISSNMLCRSEFKEDMKELKSDLMTTIKLNTK